MLFFGVSDIHAQDIDIIHIPVTTAEQGVAVAIVAKSFASENVAPAMLFFRRLGENSYQKQRMVKEGDEFRGSIPAEIIMPEAVEYYIVFYGRAGKTYSHPADEPQILPHVMFVKSPAEVEWLEILYPEPNSVIFEKLPEISAAFLPGTLTVDAVKVKLDEQDVTQKCELTEDFFLYVPEEELAVGWHRLTIQLPPTSASGELQSVGEARRQASRNEVEKQSSFSWHFRIAGRPPLLTRPNGFASILWQRNYTTSDSPFLLYNPGSNVNVTAQFSSELLARQLSIWFNRSSLYQTKDTELSSSLTGERFQISMGDIFPTFSQLTLDSMPARGGQIDFSLKNATFSAVAAQTNFLIGEDEFLSALLKSRFTGGRVEFKLPHGIRPSLVFLYATDSGEEPEAPLVVRKRDYLYSGALNLSFPKRFRISAEWARDEKRNIYESAEIDFESSEYQSGDVFFMRIKKSATPLSLELSYQNVGEQFSPEVNPFWESGKRGVGLSARYNWQKGMSAFIEYGRYSQTSATDDQNVAAITEGNASFNLALPRLPTFYVSLNQQRIPYAGYSLKGASLNVTYNISRLQFSSSYSLAQADFWSSISDGGLGEGSSFSDGVLGEGALPLFLPSNDDIRKSASTACTFAYEIVKDKLTASLGYSGYSSSLKDEASQKRRQIWFSLHYQFPRRNVLQTKLEHLKFADSQNQENDYVQRVLNVKYDTSF
jgi:hypothetical protein